MLQRLSDRVHSLERQIRRPKELDRLLGPRHALFFYQDNVTASQSGVALSNGLGSVQDYVMPASGFVVGVGVYSNADRTAGQLQLSPRVNGSPLAVVGQLDAVNVNTHVIWAPRSLLYYFAAGSRVGLEITTDASWAPITADINASVYVEFTSEVPSF